MMRFYPSIYLDDKVLIMQTMSRDVVFHETPLHSRPDAPMLSESELILSEKRLYFRFPYENASLLPKWHK